MASLRCVGVALFVCCAFAFGIDAHELFTRADRPRSIIRRQSPSGGRPSFDEYVQQRTTLIQNETDLGFESDVSLSQSEKLANEIIMRAKKMELDAGHIDPHSFAPSRHIFEVLGQIKNSDLFKILRKMPKGGILHAHDTALCSADYLVVLTYYPDLWQCTLNGKINRFLFARVKPPRVVDSDCDWTLVADERQRAGALIYDKNVRRLFTLFDMNVNPKIQFADINAVWSRFMQLFIIAGDIITYAPVWKDYYKQALSEMYNDNVQYLEFRGLLPAVRKD